MSIICAFIDTFYLYVYCIYIIKPNILQPAFIKSKIRQPRINQNQPKSTKINFYLGDFPKVIGNSLGERRFLFVFLQRGVDPHLISFITVITMKPFIL